MKDQIARWQHHAAARAAAQALSDARPVLETAIAIQQIAAPTFAEGPRAAFVGDQMQQIGLSDVATDAIGNVYGRSAGNAGGPGLLIAAHTDTVFPAETNLQVRHEGDRIYGPGIGDNSLGVAGLLHLAQAIVSQRIPHQGDIWFVANVGEEGLGDLRGMRGAVERLRDRVQFAIALEGCGPDRVIHEAIGVRRYRISVQAAGGHSWQNFGEPSAIHALVRLAARLSDMRVPATPRTTFNIGTIQGGSSINTIAEHAELLLDLRSSAPPALRGLVQQVEALIDDARSTEPGVSIQAEVVGNRPAGAIPRHHPLVQAAATAAESEHLRVRYGAGSTDANIPLSEGIPAICVGLSDGDHAHRLDEYIEPRRLPQGLRSLLWLTLAATSRDT